MLEALRPGMTKPDVVCCPDGHFRRAVYGIGPYIADYPEQALLACVVQGWCLRCVVRSSFVTRHLICLPRCTAPAKGIDDAKRGYRSSGHTSVLVKELELGVLWDEYGLVGNIVVRIVFPSRIPA